MCPTSVYGMSKLAGERECRPGTTIVRTSWLCGAHGKNIVKTALRLADGDGELRFVDDQQGSPTFTADLAPAIVTLGLDRRPGPFHVTGRGVTTWFGLVRQVFTLAGADPERVRPIKTSEPQRPGAPPRLLGARQHGVAPERAAGAAPWEESLARLVPFVRAELDSSE